METQLLLMLWLQRQCWQQVFLSHRQLRELRSSSVTGRGSGRGSVGSLSPNLSSSGSPHAPNRSPAGIKRRPASFHARTSRTPRPNDLKVTPFSRMLNTPTSVDSLPRLRRFTSSQTQLSSFAHLSHDEGPGGSKSPDAKHNKEEMVAKESAGTPQPSTKDATKEKEDEREEERKRARQAQSKGEVKQTRPSEVLCQPVSEIQGPTASRVKADPQDSRDLVQVPLSGLKSPAGPPGSQEMLGEGEVEGDGGGGGDTHGDDQKMCCGFFFKVNYSLRIIYRTICIVA